MPYYPSSPSHDMAVDPNGPTEQHHQQQHQQHYHQYPQQFANQAPGHMVQGAPHQRMGGSDTQQAYGTGTPAYPPPVAMNYAPPPYMGPMMPGYVPYGVPYTPVPPPLYPAMHHGPTTSHPPPGLHAPYPSWTYPDPRGRPGSFESRSDSEGRETEQRLRDRIRALEDEVKQRSTNFHQLRNDYEAERKMVEQYRDRAHRAEDELKTLKAPVRRRSHSPERRQDRDDMYGRPHPRPRSPPQRPRDHNRPRPEPPVHKPSTSSGMTRIAPSSSTSAPSHPRLVDGAHSRPTPSVQPPQKKRDPMSFSDEDDDDDDELAPLWDEKVAKRRAANMTRRKGTQKSMDEGTSTAGSRRGPVPVFVPLSAAVDKPRVPGAEPTEVPKEAAWPECTDIRVADVWHDYMPYTKAQLQELMRSAREHGGGAHNRVIDLLYQYDRYGALGGYRSLQALKTNWRKSSSQRPDTKGPAPPSRDDPPEAWQGYWKKFGKAPSYLRTETNGLPSLDSTRGHILLRRVIPRLDQHQSNQRAEMLTVINELFSITGLYATIVERGRYPVAPVEKFSPYPYNNYANISVFDVARWYAHCGLSKQSTNLMQPVAFWFRQAKEGRDSYSTLGFTMGIVGIEQLDHVPTEQHLSELHPAVPIGTRTADGDTVMGDDGAPAGKPAGIMADKAEPLKSTPSEAGSC